MKIEAVSVCINYSHVLKYCLDNKKYLDNWIIVTVEDDTDTINLCKENSINYIFSRRIHENGAEFAKGKAMNEGFNALDRSDWMLALDSDIILPPNVREFVSNIPRKEKNLKSLYSPFGRRGLGLGRGDDFLDFKCSKSRENISEIHKRFIEVVKKVGNDPNKEQIYLDTLRSFVKAGLFESDINSIEEQWLSYKTGNWDNLPYIFEGGEPHFTGYFQLFHSSNFTKYPEDSSNTWWDDTIFRDQFPPDNRIILDFECIHIGYNSGVGLDVLSQLDKLFYNG